MSNGVSCCFLEEEEQCVFHYVIHSVNSISERHLNLSLATL